jgi:hypothetical protein
MTDYRQSTRVHTVVIILRFALDSDVHEVIGLFSFCWKEVHEKQAEQGYT